MRKATVFLFALVLCTAGAVPALADTAFTMSERQLMGRLGLSYYVTSNYLDGEGDRHHLHEAFYREIGGHLTLRWAVLDKVELGFAAHVINQYINDKFDEENETALGDVELDTLWRIIGGHRAALGVSAKVKLPYFYDETKPLPPGDGQLDLEGRVLGGVKISLFTVGVDVGYRYRDEDPADLYVCGAEIGFAYNIVYGTLRLDGHSSVGNEADDAQTVYWQRGPDYDAGYTHIQVGIKAGNHWSFDFTAIYPAYGRNISQGTMLLLGTNVQY